jgi:anaerobic selenocysteine-containing dehydrogenase
VFTEFSRRDFFKKAGVLSAALALSGCGGERAEERLVPFLRSPEEEVAGVFTDYASICRQCPAGCGILVRTMGGRAHKIEGNPRHPLNQGKLCARGQAGLQALYNPDRITGPQARTAGRGSAFGSVSWEDGVTRLADALQKAQSAGGSGAPRVAVLAGQLPDHLYRIAALTLAALGTSGAATSVSDPGSPLASRLVVWDLERAIDGTHSLIQAASTVFREAVAGNVGATPTVGLPVLDLAAADVAVSFGADLFGTWLSPVYLGRAFGEMRRGRATSRGYLVQVDPRLSATGVTADEWLAVPPGREADVAMVMGRVILDEDRAAADRPSAVDAVFSDVDARGLSSELGLEFETLVRLARLFADASSPLAVPGGGLGARENGGDAFKAVMALNVLVGAAGRTVRAPVAPPDESLTPTETVSSFADVRTLVEDMTAGSVDVLLVLDGDPLHDLPAALGFREAISSVPLVVDFSPFPTDTGEQLADLRLPTPTYLETWGYQMPSPSPGMEMLAAQQPIVRQLHDTRSAVDVLLAVTKGLDGAQGLPWETEVDYLKASVNTLAEREDASIAETDPEVLWVKWQQYGGWWATSEGTGASSAGGDSPDASSDATTSDAAPPAPPRSETVPPIDSPSGLDLALAPPEGDTAGRFGLLPYLSLGLADGRHANLPWMQETPDPMTSAMWDGWVEVNPTTADDLGLSEGDIVKVTSDVGSVEVPVYVYPGVAPDMVAMPLGQGHLDYGRYASGRGANAADLLVPVETRDGELAWGATMVTLEKTGRSKTLATLEGSDSTVVPEGL